MNELGQTRPTSMERLVRSRWFPIVVTVFAIISIGVEVWAILRVVSGLVGR